MNIKQKHYGFSLTEVLMAVGILSVGMLLIATMFPVGIYLTSVASERTMAAIVADEAFAKIQLYDMNGITPNDNGECHDWGAAMSAKIADSEFAYPPVDSNSGSSQYYWSALYRKTPDNPGDKEYQITVFVARKTSPNLKYECDNGISDRPGLKFIIISTTTQKDKLRGDTSHVNPPTTIIDKASGGLYRVIRRGEGASDIITLDRDWDNTASAGNIWYVSPPTSGGKNADIEVYQRIIKF